MLIQLYVLEFAVCDTVQYCVILKGVNKKNLKHNNKKNPTPYLSMRAKCCLLVCVFTEGC